MADYPLNYTGQQIDLLIENGVPRIGDNDTWETWDVEQMQYVDTHRAAEGTQLLAIEYGVSASASVQPTTWTLTIPIVPGGQFLWQRYTWSDGTYSYLYAKQLQGGSGSGDMSASDYDPNGDVLEAGGIVDYVEKSDGFMGWGKSKDIVFNADGSITETSGDYTRQTVFNGNVITETVKKNGTTIITKTTTFNNDGSISEVIV